MGIRWVSNGLLIQFVNNNFWTLEEFNKFITILKDDTKYETLFYLLFYSGMRIGEALALNYADFDFKENTTIDDFRAVRA